MSFRIGAETQAPQISVKNASGAALISALTLPVRFLPASSKSAVHSACTKRVRHRTLGAVGRRHQAAPDQRLEGLVDASKTTERDRVETRRHAMPNGNPHNKQVVTINHTLLDERPLEIGERSADGRFVHVAPLFSVLGEMTGGIVHDLRNILTTIESCLRLAERNIDEPAKILDFVAGAREGVSRGLRLTSQLLTLAQHGEAHTCVANVTSLLENLEIFLKCGAGPSICVVVDLCPTIPNCLVDPSQFAAAVLNLVINARDAMPNGGEIRISVSLCDLQLSEPLQDDAEIYIRVRIQDSGLGMSERVAKRIVEPFFTTKGEKGSGLGVPRVCAFMRRMGGRVSIVSAQNRGTTFDLLFPAIMPESSVARGDRGNVFRPLSEASDPPPAAGS
jgi:signal transduction histidine kinase